jgi:hypothetical protein
VPAAVIRPIVLARGRHVLHQDADMLALQSERIATFGGESFTSTELDLLGAPIWRLLRQAERAEGLVLTTDEDDTEATSPTEITLRA